MVHADHKLCGVTYAMTAMTAHPATSQLSSHCPLPFSYRELWGLNIIYTQIHHFDCRILLTVQL